MNEQNAKSLQTELFKVNWFVMLSQSIQEWRRLQYLFQQQLAPELQSYCQFNHYKNGCLLLGVQNGAFATRIRYLAPDLIKILKTYSEFSDIRSIKCQVELELFAPVRQHASPKLSAKSAGILASIKKFLKP